VISALGGIGAAAGPLIGGLITSAINWRAAFIFQALGTAIAGTILVAGITATPERAYGLAMAALAVIGLMGLIAAAMMPRKIAAVSAQNATQHES